MTNIRHQSDQAHTAARSLAQAMNTPYQIIADPGTRNMLCEVAILLAELGDTLHALQMERTMPVRRVSTLEGALIENRSRGSKFSVMAKTQFIRRVERLRKKEAENVRTDEG